MCFGSKSETPTPQTPAKVLNQDAPSKKTANKTSSSNLAIGTKKYRTDTSGLGSTSTSTSNSPVIPSVSK
jgi:hypothetical protein